MTFSCLSTLIISASYSPFGDVNASHMCGKVPHAIQLLTLGESMRCMSPFPLAFAFMILS